MSQEPDIFFYLTLLTRTVAVLRSLSRYNTAGAGPQAVRTASTTQHTNHSNTNVLNNLLNKSHWPSTNVFNNLLNMSRWPSTNFLNNLLNMSR